MKMSILEVLAEEVNDWWHRGEIANLLKRFVLEIIDDPILLTFAVALGAACWWLITI